MFALLSVTTGTGRATTPVGVSYSDRVIVDNFGSSVKKKDLRSAQRVLAINATLRLNDGTSIRGRDLIARYFVSQHGFWDFAWGRERIHVARAPGSVVVQAALHVMPPLPGMARGAHERFDQQIVAFSVGSSLIQKIELVGTANG
jgi:hypothetical protein